MPSTRGVANLKGFIFYLATTMVRNTKSSSDSLMIQYTVLCSLRANVHAGFIGHVEQSHSVRVGSCIPFNHLLVGTFYCVLHLQDRQMYII